MFKTFQNAVKIGFTLVPDGPMLIRASNTGLDPGVAEIEFQRCRRNGRSTVFLAGSGLKGALRSHGERLLRSQGIRACDPTDQKARCKLKKPKNGKTAQAFRGCAACYTFGSLDLAGRFRVADAYPHPDLWKETNFTEVRTQVGINRKSQAARGGALFDLEAVVGGGFEAQISGENFSLWQVGLMLQILEDLNEGLVPIGGCKSRGMGTVRVEDLEVDFRFLNSKTGWLTGAESEQGTWKFRLPESDQINIEEIEGGEESSLGMFRRVKYAGEAVGRLNIQLYAQALRPFLELEENRHG